MRLKGKIAIITGAGSGIGRACAIAFAREGAMVSLVGRREEKLDEVVSEIGRESAIAIAGDINDNRVVEAIVDRTLKHFGGINVLLNNAGVMIPGTAESCSEEEWDRMFNTNVKALWMLSRAVLPQMRQAGGGSIVNISSVLGLIAARDRAAYAASKGAVTLLTRCMAIDHADDRIRVNCICPSFVVTDLTTSYLNKLPNPEENRRKRLAAHPIGRFGQPEDIAPLAVYLASDESAWVTGAAYPVDGGYTAV